MAADEPDLVLARLAVARGLLTQEEFDACLRLRNERTRAGSPVALAALLVERGLLTSGQIAALRAGPVADAGAAALSSALDAAFAHGAGATSAVDENIATAATLVAPSPVRDSAPATGPRAGSSAAPARRAASDPNAPPAHSAAPPPASARAPAPARLATGKPAPSPATSPSGAGRPPDPLLGQILGGAKIQRKLGQGGMGAVYLAHHVALDKLVAVKVLPQALTEDPTYVKRFLLEAQSAARLEHPNVVAIHNVGCERGHYFILMQYVEGESLGTLLKRKKRLPAAEAARLLAPVCRALGAAHETGLVHRDIKPDNIMLGKDGQVRVMDFGLARLAGSMSRVSASGTVVGTPFYMAPEQARGKEVDGRADLYSLGVTFHELVTGAPPFRGDTPMEVMLHHLQDPPPPPRSLCPDVPESADRVIAKLLNKEPDQRYPSAGSLLTDLDQLAAGGDPQVAATAPTDRYERDAPPPPAPPPPGARARRLRIAAGAGAALLLLLVAAVALRTRAPSEARRALDKAIAASKVIPVDRTKVLREFEAVAYFHPGTPEAAEAERRLATLYEEQIRELDGQLAPLLEQVDAHAILMTLAEAQSFSERKEWRTRIEAYADSVRARLVEGCLFTLDQKLKAQKYREAEQFVDGLWDASQDDGWRDQLQSLTERLLTQIPLAAWIGTAPPSEELMRDSTSLRVDRGDFQRLAEELKAVGGQARDPKIKFFTGMVVPMLHIAKEMADAAFADLQHEVGHPLKLRIERRKKNLHQETAKLVAIDASGYRLTVENNGERREIGLDELDDLWVVEHAHAHYKAAGKDDGPVAAKCAVFLRVNDQKEAAEVEARRAKELGANLRDYLPGIEDRPPLPGGGQRRRPPIFGGGK
ncbi:MAG: serine/threonine protein kinase [Planctomycetes bacterium]|nr:serine/threonine protein kinase [Planctomycetota bacterium]